MHKSPVLPRHRSGSLTHDEALKPLDGSDTEHPSSFGRGGSHISPTLHALGSGAGHQQSTPVRNLFTYMLAGALLMVVGTVLVVGSIAGNGNGAAPSSGEGQLFASGAVSTTHYLATQEALRCLEEGGNAVDAAAVAQFVLNVVQPQSTGIGGGFFALIKMKSDAAPLFLDAREEAPEAFSEWAFCKDTACARNRSCTSCPGGPTEFYPDRSSGGHPVGVPGVIAGVAKALREHGTWTFAQTLAPAIRIAREGFPMYEILHRQITLNLERLSKFESSRTLFLKTATEEPGSPLVPIAAVGEIFRNPDLAATLELLGEKGPEEFYTGGLAREIVDAARRNPYPATGMAGLLTMADMARYRAVNRAAVRSTYRGYTVWGAPPPSSGGASLAQMLNLDEALGEPSAMESHSWYIRLANVQNIAFSDRAQYLADPDWSDVPLAGLVSSAYAKARVQELLLTDSSAPSEGPRALPLPVAPGNPPASARTHGLAPETPKGGTTHFSIVDKDRNIVSWTTTIEENLGAALVVPGRGFLLNNELTDFSASPVDAHGVKLANRPEGGTRPRRTSTDAPTSLGGKRPMSSMSPTIAIGDRKTVVIGSPGGSSIIGTVLNVLVRILQDVNPVRATNAPRLITKNRPEALADASLVADR